MENSDRESGPQDGQNSSQITGQKPLNEIFNEVKQEMAKMVVGQSELVKNLFICILCEGHALIEGVPGLGKTLMVRSLSQILDLKYSRIQFTPDLMPADILGTNFVNEDESGKRGFKFYRGPIFGQIILADEINRATPKTQSALLEAMQEGHVTLFGKQHTLEPPFTVLATQNPLEMEGTYPLPEAQVDRFLFKLLVDYPDMEELSKILDITTEGVSPIVSKVLNADQILEFQPLVKQIPIASHVKEFAIKIIMATHPDNEMATEEVKTFVRFGASPRGLQGLVKAAKARALIDGRYNVAIEDIKFAAKPVLRHRILLNLKGIAEGINPDTIITNIVQSF